MVTTVDRITKEAREVDFGRALLAVLAAILMFLGKALAGVVTAVAWTYVAMRAGYREVRPRERGGR